MRPPAKAATKTTKTTVECQTGASMMCPQQTSTSSDEHVIEPAKKDHKKCQNSNRRSIFARLFSRGMKPQTIMPSASPIHVGGPPTPPPAAMLPTKNK